MGWDIFLFFCNNCYNFFQIYDIRATLMQNIGHLFYNSYHTLFKYSHMLIRGSDTNIFWSFITFELVVTENFMEGKNFAVIIFVFAFYDVKLLIQMKLSQIIIYKILLLIRLIQFHFNRSPIGRKL